MLFLGTDHGGFKLKEQLKKRFNRARIPFTDLGAHTYLKRDDYPPIAARVARAVAQSKQNRGILLCRSGVGVNIVANKVKGIRSVLAADAWTAKRSRRDEEVNILSLQAERLSETKAWSIIGAWLTSPFRGAARDRRRLRQIQTIERGKR